MASVVPIPKKQAKRTPRPKLVHQFLVVLSGTDPLVWRRIQVPEKYSFWDLHVALQDAMGWLDYHLHEFRLLDAKEQEVVSIGIPTDDDPEDRPVVPGWEVPLANFFDQRVWHAPPAMYAYDFGDDWQHLLVHEGFESADDDPQVPAVCCWRGPVSARGLWWCPRLCRIPPSHRRSRPRRARVDTSVGRGTLRPGGLRSGRGEVR